MSFLRALIQNWFLLGILLVIFLAKLAPNIGSIGGILKPEITVKYIGVAIIFFNSGLSLKTEQLTGAVLQVRIHVFVQCFTFIVFPTIIHILVFFLQSSPLEGLLLDGLKILSCMPPPVSSAVILTKSVGGNEAAAVFNSAFGSFLGIFVTPTLVLATVGSSVEVPASAIFIQLCSTVVLPLVFGQIIRATFRQKLDRNQIPFSTIGSCILLFIIYTTFCDTFSHKDIQIDEMSLVSIIFLVILLQAALMLLVFFVSTQWCVGLQPVDTVSLLFCCTHKSLTLGIPILKIIFGGYDGLSVISLPLLVYHPVQILLGGLMVPSIRGWLVATERFRYMYPNRHRISQFLHV